jgi:hypothetical protein
VRNPIENRTKSGASGDQIWEILRCVIERAATIVCTNDAWATTLRTAAVHHHTLDRGLLMCRRGTAEKGQRSDFRFSGRKLNGGREGIFPSPPFHDVEDRVAQSWLSAHAGGARWNPPDR